MENTKLLEDAISIVGLKPLAKGLGVSYQAIRKWQANKMPRTEYTGETNYAEKIEQITEGKVKKSDLLRLPSNA